MKYYGGLDSAQSLDIFSLIGFYELEKGPEFEM